MVETGLSPIHVLPVPSSWEERDPNLNLFHLFFWVETDQNPSPVAHEDVCEVGTDLSLSLCLSGLVSWAAKGHLKQQLLSFFCVGTLKRFILSIKS